MIRYEIKKILIVLLCLIALQGRTQQYNFKNYTAKNGLAGSSVNTIFQDSKGYLWFGTQGGGVSRFDYKTFVNYTRKEGLVGNDVTFVTEDRKGNVWIATSEGVSMFDGIK
ncbi:MAG: hypothetical protein M3R27_02330, partial [Bacteroidota bacterium]|nr:hypothetical protein [Bacteroidota bacterium]